METPIIQTATKSQAKVNHRRLTEINSHYHALLSTLRHGPESVRNKGSWLWLLKLHTVLETFKPGSHLCDKHEHKHKLATFSHVKQAQENKAYASAVTLEEI